MKLQEYLKPLLRWLWLPVVSALVAMAVSYLALPYYGSWPLYQATATVLIGGDIPTRDSDWTSFEMSKNLLPTYAELARRPPVTQAVIDALGLSVSADELRKSISAEVVGNTQLIEISVTDNHPQRAADIANEIAQQLVNQAPISAPPGFIRITEPARASLHPDVTPHGNILVAGMTGLVAGIGIAFLIEHFDDTIRAPENVMKDLGLETLGTVKYVDSIRGDRPFGSRQWNTEKEQEMLVKRGLSGIPRQIRDACLWPVGHLWRLLPSHRRQEQERQLSDSWLSCLADACRLLGIGIRRAAVGSPSKLLITSPGPLEGGSTVAVGLATAWAETGQKVVLVDAHLRRPKLHEWFGLSNDIGLSTLLKQKSPGRGGKGEKQILARTEGANLTVLVSGPSDSQNSAYLVSPQLQDVLDDLAKRADVVIVDGPPVLSTPDAAILASKVDGILLVFKARKTRLKAAIEAVRILTRAGGNILGAVLFSPN